MRAQEIFILVVVLVSMAKTISCNLGVHFQGNTKPLICDLKRAGDRNVVTKISQGQLICGNEGTTTRVGTKRLLYSTPKASGSVPPGEMEIVASGGNVLKIQNGGLKQVILSGDKLAYQGPNGLVDLNIYVQTGPSTKIYPTFRSE